MKKFNANIKPTCVEIPIETWNSIIDQLLILDTIKAHLDDGQATIERLPTGFCITEGRSIRDILSDLDNDKINQWMN